VRLSDQIFPTIRAGRFLHLGDEIDVYMYMTSKVSVTPPKTRCKMTFPERKNILCQNYENYKEFAVPEDISNFSCEAVLLHRGHFIS
jgi:hypothetical protein